MDDNWYHGELNGCHGFLPASYIQLLRPLSQTPPQGKALYDFEVKDKDQDKDCLAFSKVTVWTRVWAFNIVNDKVKGNDLPSCPIRLWMQQDCSDFKSEVFGIDIWNTYWNKAKPDIRLPGMKRQLRWWRWWSRWEMKPLNNISCQREKILCGCCSFCHCCFLSFVWLFKGEQRTLKSSALWACFGIMNRTGGVCRLWEQN